MQPEITRLPIGTVTADFEGLEIELLKYNLGWFPRDESPPPPAEDEVFTTFFIRVRNGSVRPHAVLPASFRYRTIAESPGRGPTWDASLEGRAPGLQEGVLAPGDEVEGWVTYRVPKGEIPDELLWSPSPDVAFAIYLPPVRSLSRIERALVFGRVTEEAGNPVPGVEVQVTRPWIPTSRAILPRSAIAWGPPFPRSEQVRIRRAGTAPRWSPFIRVGSASGTVRKRARQRSGRRRDRSPRSGNPVRGSPGDSCRRRSACPTLTTGRMWIPVPSSPVAAPPARGSGCGQGRSPTQSRGR
jgi:hypothetical protein